MLPPLAGWLASGHSRDVVAHALVLAAQGTVLNAQKANDSRAALRVPFTQIISTALKASCRLPSFGGVCALTLGAGEAKLDLARASRASQW